MLRQRSISSVGIVLFAAVPAFIGGYVFAAAMLLLTVLGLHELMAAFEQSGLRPFRNLSMFAGAVFLLVSAFRVTANAVTWLLILLLIGTMTFAVLLQRVEGMLVDWSVTLSAVIYVALPLFFAVALRATPGTSTQHWTNSVAGWFHSPARGLAWIGIVFSVTWLNDTAAYLIGRQFGRTKLIPRLSPGKTRVGAIAGVIAGTLTGAFSAWLFGAPISFGIACAVGSVLSISGQFGDLAESAIKRSLGIKDMGMLIPGHGGIMDRIDALLFTFPLAYLLVQLLDRIGWM